MSICETVSHVFKMTDTKPAYRKDLSGKPFAIGSCQVFRKPLKQLAAVFGFFIPFLLKFNNIPADLPIGMHQNGIYLHGGFLSADCQQIANLTNKLFVWEGLKFHYPIIGSK